MDNNNVLGGDAGGFLLGLLLAGGLGGGFGGNRNDCCCETNTQLINQGNFYASQALQSDNINELGNVQLQGMAALSKQICDGFLNVSNQFAATNTLILQNEINNLRDNNNRCESQLAAQNVIAALSGPIQGIACCCNNVNSKIPCYPIIPDSNIATLATALKTIK